MNQRNCGLNQSCLSQHVTQYTQEKQPPTQTTHRRDDEVKWHDDVHGDQKQLQEFVLGS